MMVHVQPSVCVSRWSHKASLSWWDREFTQGLPSKVIEEQVEGLVRSHLPGSYCCGCLSPPSMKVKDVKLPVITLNFIPGVGIFQCVSTGMTITGKR